MFYYDKLSSITLLGDVFPEYSVYAKINKSYITSDLLPSYQFGYSEEVIDVKVQ